MDSSIPSITSGNITSTSTIITSTPASTRSSCSVIVDPTSSDDRTQTTSSALLTTYSSTSTDPHHTPKRVSSSTVSSPIQTPPTGKILSRNCNGTSKCWNLLFIDYNIAFRTPLRLFDVLRYKVDIAVP